MKVIKSSLVADVTGRARDTSRKRINHNFHEHPDDLLQRMLNALEPGTYIRPHKHENPYKREAFIILTGRVLYAEFDDAGKITGHTIMDREAGVFGLEITPGAYHTLVCLESGSVLYEIKDGPYDPESDKNFAPWAPEESSKEGRVFIEKILTTLLRK